MPRIRTIKPEFWSNDILCELSIETHAFAAGLLNHCDDEGFFNANPKMIGVTIFPLRDEYRNSTVHLQELSKIGFIDTYNGADGRVYGHVVKFKEHQVINKPKPSKIKDLIDVPYEYGISTVSVPVGKERKGTGKGKEQGTGKGKETDFSIDDDFNVFWKLYPRKKSKPEAKKAYIKALEKDSAEEILDGLKNYLQEIQAQKTEEKFIKHGATWLNQECWNDVPNLTIPNTGNENGNTKTGMASFKAGIEKGIAEGKFQDRDREAEANIIHY